jgi:O-antigen/teichoic acid export membrane protein
MPPDPAVLPRAATPRAPLPPPLPPPPDKAGARRRNLDRFAVILSGEVIQSLFHFVLNIALVRALPARDYGLFAMVFTVGAVGIAHLRALVAVPATLHLARSLGRPAERGHDVAFGTGAALLCLALAAGVAAALAPAVGPGALAGGAFVGLYGFRSYLRIVLLARAAPRVASLSDAVYAACGLAFVVWLFHGEGVDLLDWAFVGLAAANAAAVAVALVLLRAPVRLSLRAPVRRRYAAIWPTLAWSLVGVVALTAQGQGLTLLLGLVAGPAAYAPIAATVVLFAPLRIPTAALYNMVLPDIARLLAMGARAAVRRLVLRATALIGLGCLVYGLAIWATLPLVEEHLFKGRFADEPMAGIALGVWTVVTVSLLAAIPRASLEASAAFRTIAVGAVGSAVLGFAVMIPLLLTRPAAWALIGLAASELAMAAWSARALRAVASPGARVTAP